VRSPKCDIRFGVPQRQRASSPLRRGCGRLRGLAACNPQPGALDSLLALETLAGSASLVPPRLSAPPLRRVAAAADGVRLEASSATGLAYLMLYANGRPLRRAALSGGTAVVPVTERARPEIGRITAVAVDENGIVSSPLSIDTGPSRPGRGPGKLWGLFVGIDSYPLLPNTCGSDGRSPCDLTLAAADARRLAHAVGQSRLYKSKETTVLVDKEASRSAVLARLGAMVESAGSEDTIVVSFAGHGLRDDDALRLVLSSTSLDDLAGTSLAFADVATRLKSARARVIVLLDVCHADAVSQLVTASGASMIILSASKGRQLSEEDTRTGGGRFSVTIDNILSKHRSAFDLDGNGAISVAELYRGLKSEVVRDTVGRQTPWLSRNLMVGDTTSSRLATAKKQPEYREAYEDATDAGKFEELRAIFVHRSFSHTWKVSRSEIRPTVPIMSVGKAIDFVRRSCGVFGGEGGKMRLVKLLPRWLSPRRPGSQSRAHNETKSWTILGHVHRPPNEK
jgi:Caspase domain